jgi:hypothetical protein
MNEKTDRETSRVSTALAVAIAAFALWGVAVDNSGDHLPLEVLSQWSWFKLVLLCHAVSNAEARTPHLDQRVPSLCRSKMLSGDVWPSEHRRTRCVDTCWLVRAYYEDQEAVVA